MRISCAVVLIACRSTVASSLRAAGRTVTTTSSGPEARITTSSAPRVPARPLAGRPAGADVGSRRTRRAWSARRDLGQELAGSAGSEAEGLGRGRRWRSRGRRRRRHRCRCGRAGGRHRPGRPPARPRTRSGRPARRRVRRAGRAARAVRGWTVGVRGRSRSVVGAGDDTAHERQDATGRGALLQVAVGAGAHAPAAPSCRPRSRCSTTTRALGQTSPDLRQRLEPVHHGHGEVEQHEVGLQLLGAAYALEAVLRLGDHLEVTVLLEGDAEQETEVGGVVDDDRGERPGRRRRQAHPVLPGVRSGGAAPDPRASPAGSARSSRGARWSRRCAAAAPRRRAAGRSPAGR